MLDFTFALSIQSRLHSPHTQVGSWVTDSRDVAPESIRVDGASSATKVIDKKIPKQAKTAARLPVRCLFI